MTGDDLGDIVRFADLLDGEAFRLVAGRWEMRKLSSRTAARIGAKVSELAHEFDGLERCVRLPSLGRHCRPYETPAYVGLPGAFECVASDRREDVSTQGDAVV